MKSRHLTLRLSPADRAALNDRAGNLGISVSEVVCRAVAAYDPECEDTDFAALVADFGRVVDASDAQLDASLARLAEFEAFFARAE